MRSPRWCFVATCLLALACFAGSIAQAQDEPKKKEKKGFGGFGGFGRAARPDTAKDLIDKMMAFDKSKDGKLTREELIDTRLHDLFDRADTKKTGVITAVELEALFAREKLDVARFGPGKGGPGKGPGPKNPKGPNDAPRFRPVILPGFLLNALRLTDEQKKQYDALQKEMEGKLQKILTEQQNERLRNFGRGSGGFGPRIFNPDANRPAVRRKNKD